MMKINVIEFANTVSIEKFADEHGLSITARQLENGRWYAKFDNVSIVSQDGGINLFDSGNGLSVDSAISDYCTKISGKTIRISFDLPGSVAKLAVVPARLIYEGRPQK